MKKNTFILLLCLATVLQAAAMPLAVWKFDNGKNLETEVGMTKFSRATIPVFPGLKSQGTSSVQLLAHPKVDVSQLFAPVPRGVALRTGVDEVSGAVYAATAKLPFTLSKRQGAIAFWMRAEDWDGSELGKFHILLAANDASNPRTNELLIYKYSGSSRLRFLMGDNDVKRWCMVDQSVSRWKRGEWHFICASWTPETMTLLIDGEAVQSPRPRMSANDYQLIHLGTRGWKNEGGITLLDDVAIFPRALTRAEMDTYKEKTRPISNDRPSPMTHRLGVSTPVLDGEIKPFEYGTVLNSTFDLDSGELSAASRWAVARDDRNLYFACESRKPSRTAAITRHDGNVWEDESVELQVESHGRQWQFVINSAGIVYDAQDRISTWNVRGLQQKQRMQNDRWIVELALPFETLGLSPAEGEQFYFTICRSEGISAGHTAAAPLLRRFDDRANYIKAILDKAASPVEFSYHQLPSSEGRLELKATMPPDRKASFWLLGSDNKERKLYEQTVSTTQAEGRTTAHITAAGLAKEGTVSYILTEGGRQLAQAHFKYLSPEKLKVRYIMVPHGTQTLETMLALTPPLSPDQRVIQVLKTRDGKVAMRQDALLGAERAAKHNAAITWDLSRLSPGDYDYYLSIPIDGTEKVLHHQLFQKPSATMPWTNFNGGIDTVAPAPWHAPEQIDGGLSCLTQVYDFDGRLFPSQIFAQGKPLLAAPVTLRCNGNRLDLAASWQIVRETPLETHFRTTAKAAGIVFTVNGILEYDGWMQLSMTYASEDPAQPAVVNDLALLLPMAPECSTLVNTFIPQYASIPSGRLGKGGESDIMDHPVFWVGNAERGLFWGADSMRGTYLAKTDKTLVISRENESSGATSCVRLVDSPLQLKSSRTFQFGIQATPVKIAKHFPKPWMFRGGDTIASGPPWKFFRIFNYANPDYIDRDKARSEVIAAGYRTPIYAIYASVYGASPFCPEWAWNCDAWGSTPPGPGIYKQDYPTKDEHERNQGIWCFGCVANPDFLNWQLYDKNLLIQDKEIGLRDIYIDMGYPRACNNPQHGCAWKDDFGNLRKTYPINANRTFAKRLRKLLRDKNKDSVLIYHSSNETLPPVCGLVDFTVEGEMYIAEIARNENYYDLLTPEFMQSAWDGIRTGTSVIIVAQLNRAAMLLNPARSEYWRRKVKAPEAVRAVRHFLGYCLIHDMRPQAGAGIYTEGEILEKQLYSLGYGEGNYVFYPYWGKERPVHSTGSPVLLTAFTFPGGKTLAVVLNDSKSSAAQVKLSLQSGKKARRIYDLESGSDVTFPLTVPKKGFRLVVFEEL